MSKIIVVCIFHIFHPLDFHLQNDPALTMSRTAIVTNADSCCCLARENQLFFGTKRKFVQHCEVR